MEPLLFIISRKPRKLCRGLFRYPRNDPYCRERHKAGSFERNLHLDKAAGSCCIDGGNNSFNMAAQNGPLRVAKNND